MSKKSPKIKPGNEAQKCKIKKNKINIGHKYVLDWRNFVSYFLCFRDQEMIWQDPVDYGYIAYEDDTRNIIVKGIHYLTDNFNFSTLAKGLSRNFITSA